MLVFLWGFIRYVIRDLSGWQREGEENKTLTKVPDCLSSGK